MFDGTVSWADLDWIRELWDGPILAKGVLRPEEAIEAAERGLDAVVVSNHGGRQLDHLPATIDVLPQIVDAAGDRLEVLIDSGFRRGSPGTAHDHAAVRRQDCRRPEPRPDPPPQPGLGVPGVSAAPTRRGRRAAPGRPPAR
jgi:hypothetical protein